MEIQRNFYLQKLVRKIGNGLVKIITGPRRCGKTYLLFTIFRNYLLQNGVPAERILQVSFDDFESKHLRVPENFLAHIKSQMTDNERYFILLDEIQLLGEFEAVLNSLLRRGNAEIFVTGSNARFLSKDVITEFRGRGDEIHMNPLSFLEFMSAFDGDKYDGWDEFSRYGGIPLVVLEKNEDDKRLLLDSLLQETYIRDIAERHAIRHLAEFEELLNILASGIGSLTNPQKLANTFKSVKDVPVSQNTLKKYIDFLVDAFVLVPAQRYDIKGKKYISTPMKYYFCDLGLRNAKLNFRQIEETHIMENIIFNELVARGFAVDVGNVRVIENISGKLVKKVLETDFVCNKGSRRIYIQSTFSIADAEKFRQECASLLKIGDAFKKIIITKDSGKVRYDENGILIMNIFDFLLNADSLENL